MKSKLLFGTLVLAMLWMSTSLAFSQAVTPSTPTTARDTQSEAAAPAPQTQPQGSTTGTAGGKKPITFTARSVQGVLAKGKQNTILTGSVKIITGSLVITADRVDLSGEDYVNVKCTGNVTVNDTEQGFSLVSERLTYQRDTEIGIAQGNVNVNDTKNNTVIDAAWVRFDQKQSIFEAAVAVQVKKRICRFAQNMYSTIAILKRFGSMVAQLR